LRGKLLIFCGVPGSGKTTIAKLITDTVEKSILVQTDGVRAMLAHPTFGNDESRLVYDACFGIAKEALRRGYLVVFDGTFMREEYRSEARKLLRGHFARVETVWVDCSLEAALRRNARRNSPVPPEKVRRMFSGFEPPRRALRVDSTRMSPQSASRRIKRFISRA